MAGFSKDKRTNNWLIPFRYAGKKYLTSSKTPDRKEAGQFKGRIEETIRLLERGSLSMPPGADPRVFIVSNGTQSQKPRSDANALSKLGEICDGYLADQQDKADNTICGEQVHLRHLKRLLGEATKLQSVGVKELQDYVNKRAKSKHRGKTITGQTIRKELVTFGQVWAWARQRKYVHGECPLYNERRKWAVELQKPAEREKFQTWTEIERRIERGGLTDAQVADLWASLFLDNDQVVELLDYVKAQARHAFIHPMFVFAAYSGARRSEIIRSQIEDFDFQTGRILLREKKRQKDKSASFRFVDLHPRLAETMTDWFAHHPGGRFTITTPLSMARRSPRQQFREMTPKEAYHHFKETLADSEWSVVRGFHVLRHSFAANLARAGVPRERIGLWMGHTTDEMMTHYQHLFPQDGASQIAVLN